ncbi:Arm DNA-binding domain-containing protein [Siccibacter turicensis]|uniref:Arm DNA-binding domain-containing protein n=1 Tax=Siccibacter turicensis TaxID=357233 RepID=UPI0033065A83
MVKPYKLANGGDLFLLANPDWRMKYRVLGREKLSPIRVYTDIPFARARQKRDEARRSIAARDEPA